MSDIEVSPQTFADAGFADLDSYRLAKFLYLFAEALRDAPLMSFDDVNDRIGTANGLASGFVLLCMQDLKKLGYIDVSRDRGVWLTARGRAAASIVGITVD